MNESKPKPLKLKYILTDLVYGAQKNRRVVVSRRLKNGLRIAVTMGDKSYRLSLSRDTSAPSRLEFATTLKNWPYIIDIDRVTISAYIAGGGGGSLVGYIPFAPAQYAFPIATDGEQ